METKPATGLTHIALSSKWNAALLLLAGAVYFRVARTFEGLPVVSIRWRAGASALAVVTAGTAVRSQLLQAHGRRYDRILNVRCRRLNGEKQELIREKESLTRKNLRLDAANRDLRERVGGLSELRLGTLVQLKQVNSRRPCPEELLTMLYDQCRKSERATGRYERPKGKIMSDPNFSDTHSASFARLEQIGAGGLKVAYRAVQCLARKGGYFPKRVSDCAWVETAADKAEAVVRGYDMTMKLQEHPNVSRPWKYWRIQEQGVLARVVAVEPLYAVSLDKVSLPWKQMVRCVRGIANGVKFLHDNLIIHHDLKPSNVGLRFDELGGITPVIFDFDVAVKLPSAQHQLSGEGCNGTLPFLPPECFLGERRGRKIDVWSLSIMTYGLVWRAALAEAPDAEVRFPLFVCAALQKASRSGRWAQVDPFGPRMFNSQTAVQGIGVDLCGYHQLKWPGNLPAGGRKICAAVASGLTARSFSQHDTLLRFNSFSLGYNPTRDQGRATASEFLDKLPGEGEY